MTSPTVKPKEGVVFCGLHFRNKTDRDIQVISVRPSNLSSDMTFKFLGVGVGRMKSMTVDRFSATNPKLKNVPFTVPAGSSKYQPIVELIPKKPGTYSIDGLIITYKYKDKLYRDFYPDPLMIRCQ
jgi:hypothetical protein